jgi:hypothetical protein
MKPHACDSFFWDTTAAKQLQHVLDAALATAGPHVPASDSSITAAGSSKLNAVQLAAHPAAAAVQYGLWELAAGRLLFT